MRMQVKAVDLKVNPVEYKRLDETHNRLPKESIDPKPHRTLVQQPQHTAPKHQRHESARTLNAMLDVCTRKELELGLRPSCKTWEVRVPYLRAVDEDQERGAEGIEGESRPDERLFSRLFNVDAGDPEGRRESDSKGCAEHGSSHHGDSIRVPDQAQCNEEASSEVESHKRRVRMVESRSHVRGKSQETGQDEENRAPA